MIAKKIPLANLLFITFIVCMNTARAEFLPRHSQANIEDFRVEHTHLNLLVDFDKKIVKGLATLTIKRLSKSSVLRLDSEKLLIHEIGGDSLKYSHAIPKEGESVLTEGIEVATIEGLDNLKITISYETTPNAPGLVWMHPFQTTSGQPMVFAMNQPIGARSWFPCQDTPEVRGTFSADIKIKADDREIKEPLLALISGDNNPKEANSSMQYEKLQSKTPIPSYLFVFAAGKFIYRAQNENIGYYADDPKMLDDAIVGFSDKIPSYYEFLTQKLGKNPWNKQDFLLLPSRFAFGGMENPGLIYINGALVEKTGRSAHVLGHEMAHMWTGNVVTNRKWKYFWLNEAWTTYWEHRAIRHVQGVAFARGRAFERHQELIAYNQQRLENLHDEVKSKLTTLHKKGLKTYHPENLMDFSVYSKGSTMFDAMENVVGTEFFDTYARDYITNFWLKPIETESFIEFSVPYLAKKGLKEEDWRLFFKKWIFEPGEFPSFEQSEFCHMPIPSGKYSEAKIAEFKTQGHKTDFSTWNRFDIVSLLSSLKNEMASPQNQSNEALQYLKNHREFEKIVKSMVDVQGLWYRLLIEAGLIADQKEELRAFLSRIGRGRIIKPIYIALVKHGHKELAAQVYEANKDNYFPLVSEGIKSVIQ